MIGANLLLLLKTLAYSWAYVMQGHHMPAQQMQQSPQQSQQPLLHAPVVRWRGVSPSISPACTGMAVAIGMVAAMGIAVATGTGFIGSAGPTALMA